MLLGAIILLGGVIMLLRYFLSEPDKDCNGLSADVIPKNVFVESGDSISFFDNTPGANEWQWEFDDGGISFMKTGKYFFSTVGHHTIVLTVNKSCTDTFEVWVGSTEISVDSIEVTITGPKTVHVGQEVQFKCVAKDATKFSWKFGESGLQDSKEQNPFYTFNRASTYKITVATDVAKNPGELIVTVLPKLIPNAGSQKTVSTHKIPSNNELISKLQGFANSGTYTKQELEWIDDNFANSLSTKVSINLKGVTTLESLFNYFSANSNIYLVLDAIPTVDDAKMITLVSVKVKEKDK